MNAACAAATRSLLRSSAARAATPRIAAASPRIAPKTSAAPSPFRFPKQNGVSCHRILRSPVELSSCTESLLPFHTVTASALLNSLLSGRPSCFGWSLEVAMAIRFFRQ